MPIDPKSEENIKRLSEVIVAGIQTLDRAGLIAVTAKWYSGDAETIVESVLRQAVETLGID